MADFREKIFYQGRPDDTENVIVFTVPPRHTYRVKTIVISNTTGGAVTFRLLVNPRGETVGIDNSIEYSPVLGANGVVEWDGDYPIEAGGSFGVRTNTADAIVFTIFGQDIIFG